MLIWVWIAEVTPSKYPNSVLLTEPSCIKFAFNLLDVSIVAGFEFIWVCAFDDKELINWNSALVTEPSAIFVASIAAAVLILASSILVIELPVPSASIVLFVNVSVELAVIKPVVNALKFTLLPLLIVKVGVEKLKVWLSVYAVK